MGIKAKQVAGVTTLVVVVVAAISAYHVAELVRLNFDETAIRGQMLAQAMLQLANQAVAQSAKDPYEALRTDGSIRTLIESSTANWPGVSYVAIVNKDGVAIAHSYSSLEGQSLTKQEDFAPLVKGPAWREFGPVYSDKIFEITLPMRDELQR